MSLQLNLISHDLLKHNCEFVYCHCMHIPEDKTHIGCCSFAAVPSHPLNKCVYAMKFGMKVKRCMHAIIRRLNASWACTLLKLSSKELED